jgi:Zn-dependent M28 family amino/carboxypeptidase
VCARPRGSRSGVYGGRGADARSSPAVATEARQAIEAAGLAGRCKAVGGEERGLFGSTACADAVAVEGWRIDCVVNLDMVAFQKADRPRLVRVEYDQGNRNPGNDAAAKAFGLQMAQVAADYTTLEIEHTDIWSSDYMPFEAKGFACIGVYEGGENPGYHKTTDTPDVLDLGHVSEIAKMVLATIYSIAR